MIKRIIPSNIISTIFRVLFKLHKLVCPSEFYLERHGETDDKWNEGDRCVPINKMSAIQWRCPDVCTKTRRGNKPYCTLPGQKWKPCRIDAG